MTTIATNPFTNRSTIKNEHDFVGREQEITTILSRARNGDSVSVVGTKTIHLDSIDVDSANSFADSEGRS